MGVTSHHYRHTTTMENRTHAYLRLGLTQDKNLDVGKEAFWERQGESAGIRPFHLVPSGQLVDAYTVDISHVSPCPTLFLGMHTMTILVVVGIHEVYHPPTPLSPCKPTWHKPPAE